MVLLCIPILSFAQNSRVEAVRADYEHKLNEYQRDLQQKKNRLKEEERKGPGQESEFAWKLWIKDLRVDVALAEERITMLNDWYQKAIKRASEEDAVEQSKKTEQQRMQRQQKSQNRQTQRNAGQSATAAQNEKEEAARKAKEEAARKAKEEQARKAFDSNKQKAMQTSEFYYNTQRAYVEHTASPQAFEQVSAQVSNNQVQRTLSNVPSGKSGKQMPGNSTFNKLQQRNRGEAVNGVYLVNQQENTKLFEQRLAAKKAASNGRYNEKWTLEQKKVALDTWLGSASEMQKSSRIDEQKESLQNKFLQKNIASHLMSEKQAAERDKDAVINALSQQDEVAAKQRQYAGMVSDRRNTETHFWSQIEDPGKQSEIIDVLVRQCRDSQGYVNSNAIRQVVEAVDLGVELMNRGQILGGDSAVTQRANEVLKVFHDMCAKGLCKKYQDK